MLPRLRAAMAAWQPLQQPAAWADEFAGWRPLLENPGTRDAIFLDTAAAGDAYYTLVSATVLPRVQQAISTGWQVSSAGRDCRHGRLPACPDQPRCATRLWCIALPASTLRQADGHRPCRHESSSRCSNTNRNTNIR